MPLSGIRVLDFSRHLPGPYATDLLVRLGAEVIKVEPPDGDPTRWLPPFNGDYGALFVLINGGKKSVVVDLKSEEGIAFVKRLATTCDVVVESYRPGVMKQFGVDANALMEINPGLVYCSVSGFGQANPRSSHDLNFVALAGLLDLQRDRDGRPVLPATQSGDMAGALYAALSIVAALYEKRTSGKGRVLDVAMSDATRAMMPTAEALYRGTQQRPEHFMLTGALPAYNVYRTRDGKYLSVAPLEPRFWEAFCNAIGHPDLIEKQYEESEKSALFETIAEAIGSKTRDEWEEVFAGIDACVEPVLTIDEAHQRLGDPNESHPLQRNFPRRTGSAEKLGASFEDVATQAGLTPGEVRSLRRSGHFEQQDKLQRLVRNAVMKFRYRSLLGRSD
ncbi:MAG: CoA transferase [Thermoanaerobaculia bacterium]